MSGEPPARWQRIGEVAHVTSDDRAVVLDLRHLDRPPYVLQGSGTLIWTLLAESLDGDALVSAVAAHYGTTVEEVGPHVRDFLAELVALGLVEPGAAS